MMSMLIDDLRNIGLVGAGSWSCNVYGVGEWMCITGEQRNGSVACGHWSQGHGMGGGARKPASRVWPFLAHI